LSVDRLEPGNSAHIPTFFLPGFLLLLEL
jgi:hypothetical protein